MADGLVIGDTNISVGGRSVPGAQLSRVKTYLFTESTDLTVNIAIASGGVNFGASQSVVIPTKGVIALGFAGETTGVTTNFNMILGFNDGSADFFHHWLDNGTKTYLTFLSPGTGTSDQTFAGSQSQGQARFSIEELGIQTGTQTIQRIVAEENDTNSHTIDGATGAINPAQIYMSVWDYT